MCQEWIKKNKIIVVILILVILVLFLYKNEENYDPSGYNFNIKRGKRDKLLIYNSNIERSRLDNVLITNSKCQGLELRDEDIYSKSLGSINGLSVENGRIDFGNGKFQFDIDNNLLSINIPNRSSIDLTNKDSRIILGTQTLTEDKLRFLNELYEKNTSAKN